MRRKLGVMAMKMMKAAIAAIAGAAALACAGAASANVYVFNVDGSGGALGSGPYGTVTTTGEGTGVVGVSVALANATFNGAGNSGQHHALTFNLLGSPSLASVTGFDGTLFSWDGPASGTTTGSFSEPSLGTFEYAFECLDSKSCGPTLNFTLTANAGSTLTFSPNGNVYFGADLRTPGANAITGNEGATLTTSPVPEPAVWAMMLVGFGGLGAMLRYRRREFAAA